MSTEPVISKSTSSSAERGFLEDRLYEFNSSQTGRSDSQLFTFFIRNESEEIVAGISGWTWASACEISVLWVHPSYRGKGYGRRLLEIAEQEARAQNCEVIFLSSYSFQAPDFYQKYGYELAYQLNDFPPGHRYNFLVRRLMETV